METTELQRTYHLSTGVLSPTAFLSQTPNYLFIGLRGANVFTTLDLCKAFFHIELALESRHPTTALTHQGLRQYKRLPMGLKDSASVCQRLVSQTLGDFPAAIAYINDILIFRSTRAEHDANLRMALRLGDKDFRLQLAKYLATTDELLRRLTRKNVRFSCTAACQSAFDKIKHAIVNSVRSFIFDPNSPTFVTTDSSDEGLGAVLSQIQQGREVPIAHISHTLQGRERSYAVNEKEALACVWTCEAWEKYLLGRNFILRTDHSSLASLLRSTIDSRKSAKFTRWLDRLSPFDYKVKYRQGKDNLVADALSRLSMRSAQSALHDPNHNRVVGALQTVYLSLLDVKSATKRDSTLSMVLHFVSSGWPSKRRWLPIFISFSPFGTSSKQRISACYGKIASSFPLLCDDAFSPKPTKVTQVLSA
ncbi:retrovirus-related pol polyprotein from transposon 17.6 [Plakobranchus ocellatus]|uniref:Retrovirus-related pol polyprotein from transposon 17.6 n=1 Tax=Plakobranchus ocellatus TaxID=259542 RepID=A0AAV3YBC3_9GAST|nr:retrovirus-related pol polyprotein from transposon 17.6 [Plakobranchus ocellatus]